MTVLYIILAVLAVVLAAVLFVKMTLTVSISKAEGEELKKEFVLSVFGCKIDLSELADDSKNKPQKKEEKDKPDEEDKPETTFMEKLHKLRVNIERGRYTYLLSKKHIRKKIKIYNFDFDMTFGLDDAAHTGIATGAVWGSIYNVFGFVANFFTVKSHKFMVTPVFDRECFSFVFNSRIRFSISNILALALAVMINYSKSKKKIN